MLKNCFLIFMIVVLLSCEEKPDNQNVRSISNDSFKVGRSSADTNKADCYNYLTKLVRSSSFPFNGLDPSQVNLLIDENNYNMIRAKVYFETEGTGTLGWILYNAPLRKLENITQDPDQGQKLLFDTGYCSSIEKCLSVKVNKELISLLFSSKPDTTLKYLYSSNGGLIGFYEDGSVRGCPRCELYKESVELMAKKDPHATYTQKEGGLVVKDCYGHFSDMEFDEQGDYWPFFDGEWRERPASYKEAESE